MLSGPTPPSPAELLSGERLKSLVKEMLQHYDHVVIDAPPVLGLTDAPLLASAVEGCVFVIQAGEASIRTIRASLQRLSMGNAHIFGAILTKLNALIPAAQLVPPVGWQPRDVRDQQAAQQGQAAPAAPAAPAGTPPKPSGR